MNLNFVIPLDNPEPKIKDALQLLRPDWNLNDVTYKNLSGGLANRVIGCINRLYPKDILLIKIHGMTSDLLNTLNREKSICKFIYRIGLSAPFYAMFQNGIIYAYTPGCVPTIDETLTPSVSSQIAVLVARYHRAHPPFIKCEPYLWEGWQLFIDNLPESFPDSKVQARYNSLLPKNNELLNEMNWLRGIIEELNSPIVFCHNDLSLTNIIYDKAQDKVTLIDFEFAYYNYQGFDIGHFFAFNKCWGNNATFQYGTDDEIRDWLKVYLKHLDDGDQSIKRIELLLKHTRYFHMVSHLYFCFWAITQIGQSIVEYDHLGYNSLLPKNNELLNEMNWLRGIIEELNSPIVFCHNDLSLTNIIYDKAQDKVTLIDFEFAYYNYQGFDIGHFFAFNKCWGNNATFQYGTDDEIRDWLKVYLKHLDDGDQSIKRIELLLKHTRYFHMVSHLYFCFWAITQIGQSIVEYDHLGYNSLLPKNNELLNEMNWLRGIIEELNSPIVFCHNDLSLTNIIYDKAQDKVTLIDFEFAYYNYQGFDIGHFFAFNKCWGNNATFQYGTDDEIRDWLKVYLKHLDDGDQSIKRIELLLKHTRYFHMVSHLYFCFWAITQIGQSIVEYDHLGYARCRLNAYYEVKKKIFPELN